MRGSSFQYCNLRVPLPGFESVAVSFQADDFGVVYEAVDQRGYGVVAEDLTLVRQPPLAV
jgi:hypothetical protein